MMCVVRITSKCVGPMLTLNVQFYCRVLSPTLCLQHFELNITTPVISALMTFAAVLTFICLFLNWELLPFQYINRLDYMLVAH